MFDSLLNQTLNAGRSCFKFQLTLNLFRVISYSKNYLQDVNSSANLGSLKIERLGSGFRLRTSAMLRSYQLGELVDITTQYDGLLDRLLEFPGASPLRPKALSTEPPWSPRASWLSLLVATELSDRRLVPADGVIESGAIQRRYPQMEIIGIGPEIQDPHTPDERILDRSIAKTVEQLDGLLKKIPQARKNADLNCENLLRGH